jgi:hypothetical protein
MNKLRIHRFQHFFNTVHSLKYFMDRIIGRQTELTAVLLIPLHFLVYNRLHHASLSVKNW